jgi:hypothetical protein
MQEGITITGLIELELVRNGKVIDKRTVKNLITSAGKAEVANLVGNVSTPAAFTYLAVGTGTTSPVAGNTALEAEISDSGLQRAAATVTRQTTNVANDTLQLVKVWSATGTKAITEIGALNAGASGVLLGRQVFSAVNVESGDSFTATYKFIFS